MHSTKTPDRLRCVAERGRIEEPRFRPNNFDLIRIFAALQVVMTHVSNHLGYPDTGGLYLLSLFPGVPIFFVTSGYLVSSSFERCAGIRTYSRNRFLRIFPGLWGCLIITFIVVLLLGYRPAQFSDYAWFPLQLFGVIYTPQFLRQFGFGSYNGSLWTIPVELQFYVLLPVAYWLIRKLRLGDKGFVALFAIATAFTLLQAALFPFADILDHRSEPITVKLLRISFAPHIYLFLLGVVFQRLQLYRLRWINGKGAIWLAGYIVAASAVPSTPVINVCRAVAAGFVTLSVAYTAPRLCDVVLRHQDISYGVYIYHGLILNLVIASGVSVKLGTFMLLIACITSVALLSWRWIEKPCLERKRITENRAENTRGVTTFRQRAVREEVRI